jgi:3'(2'), 5'-bisphosphate nucleotidase
MLELSKLLENVCHFAEEAGALIRDYYVNQNYSVTRKDDKTPMTQADWDAHLLIFEKLTNLAPYQIISEESHKAEDIVRAQTPFWLVDPLDGTKEFLNRSGDFTVNIALINTLYPILGVIYAPITNELYFASQGQGAFKKSPDGTLVKLQTRAFEKQALRFLISRNHPEEKAYILKKFPDASIERMGSSLKYCRIAEGKADVYIRKLQTYEWDTAAAQCILEEAGAKLCSLSGERMRYRKPLLKNEGLAAFADSKAQLKDFL